MKLYFYFLEKNRIRCEECNVIEKPKTYYPENRFPDGIYASFIKKEEIDRIRCYFGGTFMVLTERNNDRAAKAFINDCNYEISCKEDRIRAANEEIQRLKETINIIEQWKAAIPCEQNATPAYAIHA